jgi:hypothetical protein
VLRSILEAIDLEESLRTLSRATEFERNAGPNRLFVEQEGRKMSRHSIYKRLLCTAGLVGLVAAVPGAHTGSAQNLNDMVRTLNNVINPGDARRLEDQARRNGQPQEERYWRDYRAGLDSPERNRRDYERDGNRPNYRERDERRDRSGDRSNSGYQSDYRDQR